MPVNSGPDPALDGPNLALVRIRSGRPPAAALASLQRIARRGRQGLRRRRRRSGRQPVGGAGRAAPGGDRQLPRRSGSRRPISSSGLALGAIAALALTLLASVRQRRRDLALLKTMGFVRRQLAASVAWQATVAAMVGIVVGLPLGVVDGPVAVGRLRPPDLRGALSHVLRAVDRPGGPRNIAPGQRRRGGACPEHRQRTPTALMLRAE